MRYSVASRQREQSFGTLTDAQTFQLTLSSGEHTQGAIFTDPRAGIVPFLPLCDAYIDGMAKAGAVEGDLPQQLRQPRRDQAAGGRTVLEVARMDAEVKQLLNVALGGYRDEYRNNVRRIIVGTLDQ